MILAAILPLLLQANTAVPTRNVPLEAGRWVLRETAERATGQGGVSATLLSNDGLYRLVVRCDYSYQSDISIQFVRARKRDPVTMLPVSLVRADSGQALALVWEQTPAGVFARDGQADADATVAAAQLQDYVGRLRVEARDRRGRRITAQFDSTAGHGAIRRATSACYDT
jgi:hypothetical protein